MKAKSCSILWVVFCAASAGLAQPARPLAPLETVEILRGWVDVQTTGETVSVQVGRPDGTIDRVFKVEVADAGLPVFLKSDSAQVFFWRGHLAVLTAQEGRALHFSIPGFAASPGPATGRPVPGADLDALLARYELTKIATATAILSGQGPRALVDRGWGEPRSRSKVIDPYTPPPETGGGVGSCGVSCSISCADGSSCSATCGSKRCAACACPASCTCS
jgi:hypothetical protein